MKLHVGRLDHPGTITFVLDGYWYKGPDDEAPYLIRYPTPKPSTRRILSMWGISFRHRFFGVMKYTKPVKD